MSCLIFCSFEVGGWPYKIAEVLNQNNIEAYYVSLDRNAIGHDSAKFHYGDKKNTWDLSILFKEKSLNLKEYIKILQSLKSKYNITYCFATGHKAYMLQHLGIDYAYWCHGIDIDQCCKFFSYRRQDAFWKNCKAYFYYLLRFFIEQKRLVAQDGSFFEKLKSYFYFLTGFCKEQKKSILCASSVMIAPYQLEVYQALRFNKRLFFVPHLLNIGNYDEVVKKKAENKKKICKEIDAQDFFFSSTRHLWKDQNNLVADYKGNDIILYAFTAFLKQSRDKKTKLILIKKGPDVEGSQRLIQYLGIKDHVVWIDEIKRDRLEAYYQGASVCFGQFGAPALTYVALEPLSNATPCSSFFIDNNNKIPFYSTMPPILNTRDYEKIADFMYALTTDASYASELSHESWLWAKENCSEEKFIESFANNISMDANNIKEGK